VIPIARISLIVVTVTCAGVVSGACGGGASSGGSGTATDGGSHDASLDTQGSSPDGGSNTD